MGSETAHVGGSAGGVIAPLAAQQHGVVARRQLLALGLTSREIQRRLDSSGLHPIHRGVYAVGHAAITQHGHWMAAVLACGADAVLSHRAAAALWGLVPAPAGRIDITVGRGGRGGRPGIALHRTSFLPAPQRTRRQRIPVTTPARTLLDLASVVGPRALERAFHAADRRELVDISELAQACSVAGNRRGTGRLRSLLAQYRPMPITRSELERRFLRLCDRVGLRRPAVNVPLCGFEVDFFWPVERFVVELDTYRTHGDRRTFETDRSRDATLQLAGFRVLRITDRRLADQPDSVVAAIRALVGSTGADSQPHR